MASIEPSVMYCPTPVYFPSLHVLSPCFLHTLIPALLFLYIVAIRIWRRWSTHQNDNFDRISRGGVDPSERHRTPSIDWSFGRFLGRSSWFWRKRRAGRGRSGNSARGDQSLYAHEVDAESERLLSGEGKAYPCPTDHHGCHTFLPN